LFLHALFALKNFIIYNGPKKLECYISDSKGFWGDKDYSLLIPSASFEENEVLHYLIRVCEAHSCVLTIYSKLYDEKKQKNGCKKGEEGEREILNFFPFMKLMTSTDNCVSQSNPITTLSPTGASIIRLFTVSDNTLVLYLRSKVGRNSLLLDRKYWTRMEVTFSDLQ
jgi:hypothetical protein